MTAAYDMAAALSAWAAAAGRRPPWRQSSSLYVLAVAEVLLQKTKSQDAEPVWRALVAAYPDAESLAAARDDDVRAIVSDLGLGSQRTSRLKSLAVALSASPPPLKLPALGPYGSAIAALSTGASAAAPPVDGNVARVITRVHGLTFARGEPRTKPEVKAAVSALLDTQPTQSDQLALAYALVDLGALVCTPARPDCPSCPLESWCSTAQTARRLFVS